jgi:hypothetical protein
MWWIKAAIHEYILRSWSLVKIGTTANQKKLFFNLRKAKSKISVLDKGDLRPDQVKLIAKRLGVTEQDVVEMNRRLGGDVSLNAQMRDDADSGEWQDWLERHTDCPILVINGRAHSRHHGGKRSARPSAQRYSIATVRFSVQPSSRCTNAAVHSKRVVRSKKLMIGTLPSCCARAASGHERSSSPATAASSSSPCTLRPWSVRHRCRA